MPLAQGHKGRKWPTWTGTPQPELPSPLHHLNAEWRGSYAGTDGKLPEKSVVGNRG